MIHTREGYRLDSSSPASTGAARPPSLPFPSAALLFAAVVFVVYGSLLPLDFRRLSWDEVAVGFLGLGQPKLQLRSLSDWTTNVAIFVPLGFLGLGSFRQGQGWAKTIWNAFITIACCVLLSLGIEFTQLYFPPRDSSLLDAMANTLGAALGIVGWFAVGDETVEACRALLNAQYLRRSPRLTGKQAATLLAGCGLLIAAWGGFFTSAWTGWDAAISRLHSVHPLPFFEDQAAEISLALASAMFAVLAYAPLGAVLWLLNIYAAKPLRARLLGAAVVAASVALLVEGVKLFLVARNPDTGNVAIAGLAAMLGYVVAPLAANLLVRDNVRASSSNHTGAPVRAVAASSGLVAGRSVALVGAIAACALAATYPMGQIPLGIALLAYGAILTRYPTAWLLVVPALLPVLDLAPWTGRYFIDEFDGVVLVTLVVGLWRAAGQPLAASSARGFWLLVAGFAVSFLVSAAIGLLPMQPWDANALASPYSHYASLRAAKGLVFAAGLAVLIGSHVAAGHDVKRALGAGMILGLAAAAASVIWERIAYAGFADFTKAFRVVGMFSTMHTGGSHLDAYLVTTLPFVAAWALRTRRPTARVAAALLFAAGVYAVMMTFSRAAVAALVIEILALAAWAFVSGRRTAGRTVGSAIRVTAGLALAGMVIAPALMGSFMQSRLAATDADFGIRARHWNDAIDMMTDNWSTTLFGMGLGRYPETYQLLSPEKNKPAVHRFEAEGANTFLHIAHGAPLYVEQIVSVAPRHDYQVVLKARAQGRNASVNVLLCDRTFLGGFGCQSATFQLSGEADKWQQFQATVNSATVGDNRMRTTKLSLENASQDTSVDLDDVALVDSDGMDHVANGSFQAGADRWFFSSPFNHLPWHIKNLWLQVFFEQGWVGLLMFSALVTATVARLAWLAWRGKAFAAVLLAAMLGFLGVGAFDSLFDAPRLTLVFGLLIAVTGIVHAQPREAGMRLRSTRVPGKTPGEEVAATPAIPATVELRHAARNTVVGVLVLAVLIMVVTRMPWLPYRVRQLPNPYHPILAPILLAAFFVWVFGLPVVAARWLTVAKNRSAVYPLLVAGHGLIGWAMIRYAVLPESIHNVIGYPVLNWPWQAEYIARFVPFLSVLSVQLTGGALLAAAITGKRTAAAPVWWLVSAALLFPIQYWVVVTWAATDNLTELMAGGASVGAFLWLTLYLLLTGTTGALLASLRAGASAVRIGLTLAAVGASLPLGYLLFTAGTEAVIVKDQKVFSALQSLLSTDRAHYAVGPELWIRFAAAHFAVVCMTALAQFPLWVGWRERSRRHRGRELT